MNRPEGDEEEVVFDENEDADDDEADIDAVSLVHEFEFCYTSISLRICLGLALLEITVGHWTRQILYCDPDQTPK